MSRRYWLLRVLARCEDCSWAAESRNGMGLAAIHTKKTGHTTRGEDAHAFRFLGTGGPR